MRIKLWKWQLTVRLRVSLRRCLRRCSPPQVVAQVVGTSVIADMWIPELSRAMEETAMWIPESWRKR